MSLVLYHNPPSSNGIKVRMLLDVLGLDYDERLVPFDRPRPGWYTEWRPFGTIPALEDGDLRFGESNAILRYLAHREGRYDLYPEDAVGRAPIDYALDAWSTQVRPSVFPLERALLFADEPDPAAIEAATPAAERAYDEWEAFVADNGTVTGAFTIADCAVAPGLVRTTRFGWEDGFADRWPKMLRLREALAAHPAYRRTAS